MIVSYEGKKYAIQCPYCFRAPAETKRWVCRVCDARWNTFKTYGKCPECGEQYETTQCPACKTESTHDEWYNEIDDDELPRRQGGIFSFLKPKPAVPVVKSDRKWIEHYLLFFVQSFGDEFFKSLRTLRYADFYDDPLYHGERDADYFADKISSTMRIDRSKISIHFYSAEPDEGVTTKSETTSQSNKELPQHWEGPNDLWLKPGLLKHTPTLFIIISHELALYKLKEIYSGPDMDYLADLLAVAFGYGLFRANFYYSHKQVSRYEGKGWELNQTGYLPERMIAYAMAWLAHYRQQEDISWQADANYMLKKYFNQSIKFIGRR